MELLVDIISTLFAEIPVGACIILTEPMLVPLKTASNSPVLITFLVVESIVIKFGV